jgi:hypothetical protein
MHPWSKKGKNGKKKMHFVIWKNVFFKKCPFLAAPLVFAFQRWFVKAWKGASITF